jgi:peroxiredoxin
MEENVLIFLKWLQKRAVPVVLTAATLAIGLILALGSLEERSSYQSITISSLAVGKQAPGFTLPALDGKEISLSHLRGQPVVINFWASWCDPCRDEMPELARAFEEHKEEGLMILGVNLTFSDTLPEVQAFVQDLKVTFPVLLDEDGTVAEKSYQIPGLPTSIFINRDGTIEHIQVGVMTGKQIKKYIAKILQ